MKKELHYIATELVFMLEGTACNTTSTRAIIYPKSPYGRKDYTIKVELDCGFENTSESTK